LSDPETPQIADASWELLLYYLSRYGAMHPIQTRGEYK